MGPVVAAMDCGKAAMIRCSITIFQEYETHLLLDLVVAAMIGCDAEKIVCLIPIFLRILLKNIKFTCGSGCSCNDVFVRNSTSVIINC